MLIKDYDGIARRVTPGGYDPDEYDVIITGGGALQRVIDVIHALTYSLFHAMKQATGPSYSTVFHAILLTGVWLSSKNVPYSRIPSGFSRIFGTELTYNIMTEPSEEIAGARIYWPRVFEGKMLGGCSSVNAQIYHRGSPEDYDEWARIQGDNDGGDEWSYKNFHRYFKKFERYNPSEQYPDVDLKERGGITGMVDVGHEGHFSPITRKFIESCEHVGIPRKSDLNSSKGTLGVAKLMTFIHKSARVTTESAYLTEDVLARPNLKIAVRATVTKLLFDNGPKPRVTGVEFTSSPNGPRYRVKARKEVVLSAGAIHTPHILMLSGIGPADHLRQHSIPVVIDLPAVGAHLRDHAVIDVCYRENSGHSLNHLSSTVPLWRNLRMLKSTLQWALFSTGPLLTNVAEAAAFCRSDDAMLFPEYKTHPEDTTSGAGAPDLELFCSPVGYSRNHRGILDNYGDLMGLHILLLRPTSKGSITLKSNNPFDLPVVNANYLSTKHDLDVLVRGMRLLTRVSEMQPLSDIMDAPIEPDTKYGHHLKDASDAELVSYIRNNLATLYHPTSTARMAPRNAGGVVDARLRVYGVQGLRVADASIFPEIVSGHTAATAIAIGEKAADLIKDALGGRRSSLHE
ncbi:hypothetical protein EWM64_g6966 [Hericium alpestre]|uniref:Glucose-methanol-choline oxidoreductase N-terminal domain-containing protein n=1 Tax=Hericium alpestre TaxID=135208 RepID=A0A4Y9ZQ67_9AGAM|nr:hypothetical protein EWM64_g6966 [Hericium alpestre]